MPRNGSSRTPSKMPGKESTRTPSKTPGSSKTDSFSRRVSSNSKSISRSGSGGSNLNRSRNKSMNSASGGRIPDPDPEPAAQPEPVPNIAIPDIMKHLMDFSASLENYELTNFRLASQLTNMVAQNELIRRNGNPLYDLSDPGTLERAVKKLDGINPIFCRRIEIMISNLQEMEPNLLKLFNLVGPTLTELRIKNSQALDWTDLSDFLGRNTPKLTKLNFTMFANTNCGHSVLARKNPRLKKVPVKLENLKAIHMKFYYFERPRSLDTFAASATKNMKKLLESCPNLEELIVPSNKSKSSELFTSILSIYEDYCPKLQSFSTNSAKYTPEMLTLMTANKHICRKVIIDYGIGTASTEQLVAFLQSASPFIQFLWLICPENSTSHSIPTRHSFHLNLTKLKIQRWAKSLYFLKDCVKLKELEFEGCDLNIGIFGNDKEQKEGDNDFKKFTTIFSNLTCLKSAKFMFCEGSEKITPEIEGSIPEVDVHIVRPGRIDLDFWGII